MESVQESLREQRESDGRSVILVDAARPQQARLDWFDPAHWGALARPVAEGGRGSAWFLDTPAGELVLRHYRRGGKIAALLDDRYLWRGEDRTRAFCEFRLLAGLHAAGLPVPRPVAARVARRGAWYRADLIVERIPDARTLAQLLASDLAALPWEALGALIARFHRAGAFHADLNAHNVLIDGGGGLWLIDFDRGEHRTPASGWAMQNLARLSRSLRKLCLPDQRAILELCLARLGQGWREAWSTPSGGRP